MKCKLRYVLLFVLPALVLYTIFVVYPIGYSFNLSFFSWPGVGEKTFVGFDNFRNILSGAYSEEFFNAVGHSFTFFIANSVFELGLAFIIAVALTSKIWGKRFFQTMVYLPNVISMVLVGFIWSMILNPQWGLLNSFLELIGLENLAQPWLGQPETALPTVIMVNVWRNIGFYILVFMAAILNIPKELFEAAYIDGAKNHHIISKIIFPLVIPNMQTLAILIFIWSFNIFDVVYALEGVQAGPFRSTDVLGTLFYRTAFGGLGSSAQDYGLGAAVAVIIFIMVIPLSMVYANILDKRSRRL
jgi:raffinose/stachyose/melibiose transport system permease protein